MKFSKPANLEPIQACFAQYLKIAPPAPAFQRLARVVLVNPLARTIHQPCQVVPIAENLGLEATNASRRFQQEYIRRTIKHVSSNMSETAKSLSLHRSNLYREMSQLEMHEADD